MIQDTAGPVTVVDVSPHGHVKGGMGMSHGTPAREQAQGGRIAISKFIDRDGVAVRRTVEMTDGGVYETLGLAPLRPGRSPAPSRTPHDLDYVIAVDARLIDARPPSRR